MLHKAHHIGATAMPRGNSGRIVLEVDPELKRHLYTALAHQGLTLKTWFLARAEDYVRNYSQLSLQFVAEPTPPAYGNRKTQP